MWIAAASSMAARDAYADEPAPPSATESSRAPAPTEAAPTPREPAPAPAPAAAANPAPPPAAAAAAAAEKFGEKEPEIADAERRSGFLVGTSFGLGPGAANGYPNDAKKIGRSAFYTETGVGVGSYGAIWLGGALADGFNFGIGFGGGNIEAGDTKSSGGGIMFHADAFPLYSLGGAFRDAGIALEGGTGGATTVDAEDDTIVLIDGAGAGYVSAAVFWEGLSLWKLRSGPFLGGHYMFSETVRRPMLLAGFRTVLYTGP